MANYTEKLEVAEQAISDYINGKIPTKKLESTLSAVLSSCKFFDKANTFQVNVIKSNKGKDPFFGARVFPAMDLVNKIVEETVTEFHPFRDIQAAWASIDHWVVELDAGMFDRELISLVPKEIMAAILHEVGHTVYSGKPLERFYRAYKTMYVHMKTAEKDTIKLGYGIFAIPLCISCGLRSWTRGRNAIKEEFFADSIVKQCGYGDFYISLLNKIIEAYGNSMLDTNNAESENRVSERCRWAMTNIVDTVRRKNHLSNELYMDAANTRSDYLKALYAKTLNELGINLRERYTGDAVECTGARLSDEHLEMAYEFNYTTNFYEQCDRINANLKRPKYQHSTPAFESINRNKLKRGLPSWADLDRIQIEIDRMTNHNDRMFVLDMVYEKINEIEEFMDAIDGDSAKVRRYKPEADKMLDMLDSQRMQILNRSSFANRYKVFVQYPAGYEG